MTAVTFTVQINDDAIAEPAETLGLSLSAAQGAMVGGAVQATLTILDNDTAGLLVNPAGVTVTEGLISDTYTLSLASQPTSAVIISLSTGGQSSVTPTLLTFTALDWNQPQQVMVSAVYDAVFEGPHTDLITHTTTSGDSFYDGLLSDNVTVSIIDQTRLFIPVAGSRNGDNAAQPAAGGSGPPNPGWADSLLVERVRAWIRNSWQRFAE
jgi:hypothetical protein